MNLTKYLILSAIYLRHSDSVRIAAYRDSFGNWCSRIVAPKGRIKIASTAVVRDSGEPDVVATFAQQHSIQDLPEEALVFLLGSRYCDTEKFSEIAGAVPRRNVHASAKGNSKMCVIAADPAPLVERFPGCSCLF